DLDVNLTIPLLRTSLGVTTHSKVPDPRFPDFALQPPQEFPISISSDWAAANGVGDLLMRAKYVLLRSRYADVAAGRGISAPRGRQSDLQGTGTTQVEPGLILSHVYGGRFEPLLNVGVACNANDVSRSIVRWGVGGTYQVLEPLSASVVFLGRNELAAQSDPIPTPFFFQIERNYIYDASVGFRWRFADWGLGGGKALRPANSDRIRPEAVPRV